MTYFTQICALARLNLDVWFTFKSFVVQQLLHALVILTLPVSLLQLLLIGL